KRRRLARSWISGTRQPQTSAPWLAGTWRPVGTDFNAGRFNRLARIAVLRLLPSPLVRPDFALVLFFSSRSLASIRQSEGSPEARIDGSMNRRGKGHDGRFAGASAGAHRRMRMIPPSRSTGRSVIPH